MLLGFLLFYAEMTQHQRIETYALVSTTTMVILIAIWLIWSLSVWYWRRKQMIRPSVRRDLNDLLRIVRLKDELSAVWLRRGFSKRVLGIGVGKGPKDAHCLQVFINSSDGPFFEDSPNDDIPADYKGVPIVLVALSTPVFLSFEPETFTRFSEDARKQVRETQEVIMGGISGANVNLNGEFGTIGYFCRKKSVFGTRPGVYLLSNSHVFADLRKPAPDTEDLIVQPSPGEAAVSRRPIAELTEFAHPRLDNDTNDANFVDAAIAKLWRQEMHKPLMPLIGKVNGYVEKPDVEVGEKCRKFGRTTGLTRGAVFSVYLDIKVSYDRTGQTSFFKNQFLIVPDETVNASFVERGDSGSLVVDDENFASGLIFAGGTGEVDVKQTAEPGQSTVVMNIAKYGVANPISEVLKRLKIELL